jgi:hypothetical protein
MTICNVCISKYVNFFKNFQNKASVQFALGCILCEKISPKNTKDVWTRVTCNPHKFCLTGCHLHTSVVQFLILKKTFSFGFWKK